MRRMRRRLRRSGFYRSFFNFFVGVFGLWGCFACPTLTGLIDPSGSRRGNQIFCDDSFFKIDKMVDALLVVFPSG